MIEKFETLADLYRTHFWPRTGALLEQIAQLLPPNAVIVNIGAYTEASTIYLLHTRPDVSAFSIDIELCQPGLDNLAHFGLANRAWRILGSSRDIGHTWRAPIDLVYIDGEHTYFGCRSDIELWVPWVNRGGFICFHDYGNLDQPGVKKVVDELMPEHMLFATDYDPGSHPPGELRIYRKP